MKTTQYVRQEKAIGSADSGGIRQRWLWGLRLLRDPDAMSSEKSLRHGVTEQLVAAAQAAGRKLSDREIRRRLQCARTYETEGQIGRAVADFETWPDRGRRREGRVIVPGGRHRRVVEPSLAGPVLRRLLAQARGVRR